MFGKQLTQLEKDLIAAEKRYKEETRRLKRNCRGTNFKLPTPKQYLKEWLIMKHTTDAEFKALYPKYSGWYMDYMSYINSCTNFD